MAWLGLGSPQVHLKRFAFARNVREKLDAPVDFPLKGLNLAPWITCPSSVAGGGGGSGGGSSSGGGGFGVGTSARSAGSGRDMYDLYAVCNHHGSIHGGERGEVLAYVLMLAAPPPPPQGTTPLFAPQTAMNGARSRAAVRALANTAMPRALGV